MSDRIAVFNQAGSSRWALRQKFMSIRPLSLWRDLWVCPILFPRDRETHYGFRFEILCASRKNTSGSLTDKPQSDTYVADGKVRDVIYLGLLHTLSCGIGRCGDLVVVEQN